MAAPVHITDETFEADVLKSDKPVLVDFWAEWCGPCKQIAPALEELAAEMGEKVTIAKLNIDESQMTPGKYGVRGVPTMMIFKNGKLASTLVGAKPKRVIAEWLAETVTPGTPAAQTG